MQGNIKMISESLKKYRAKLGLSQDALARKADLPYSTMIKLESGNRKDPRLSTLIKLADALEVSLDKLVGRKK